MSLIRRLRRFSRAKKGLAAVEVRHLVADDGVSPFGSIDLA
ncbi:MAG: hypothetical protein R3C16_03740 [Hyphomonadaceae bacterium]